MEQFSDEIATVEEYTVLSSACALRSNEVAKKPVQQASSNVHTPREQLVSSEDGLLSVAMAFRSENVATEGSSRQKLFRRMRVMEKNAMGECKVTLSGMQRTIIHQKNISNDVKVGISKMAELLKVASKQLAGAPTPTTTVLKRAATSPAALPSYKKAGAKKASGEMSEAPFRYMVGRGNLKEGNGDWRPIVDKGLWRKRRKRSTGPSEPGLAIWRSDD